MPINFEIITLEKVPWTIPLKLLVRIILLQWSDKRMCLTPAMFLSASSISDPVLFVTYSYPHSWIIYLFIFRICNNTNIKYMRFLSLLFSHVKRKLPAWYMVSVIRWCIRFWFVVYVCINLPIKNYIYYGLLFTYGNVWTCCGMVYLMLWSRCFFGGKLFLIFCMPSFLYKGVPLCTTYIIFSSLQKVVGGLHDNRNIPTLLQSLGLILEHSPTMYTSYDHQLINFVQRVFVSPEELGTYFFL